jgi:trimethylamine--corrinoid protein Co-methyltransferase
VNRRGFSEWQASGAKPINDRATEILNERLSKYVKPDIDPQLEKDLLSYVQKRKKR